MTHKQYVTLQLAFIFTCLTCFVFAFIIQTNDTLAVCLLAASYFLLRASTSLAQEQINKAGETSE